MNNRYNKSFEENLRRRIEQEELGFDEKAWEMMETKLDHAPIPWFKSKGFIIASSVVGLFFFAGLSWTLFFADNDVKSSKPERVVSGVYADEKEGIKTEAIDLNVETEVVEQQISEEDPSIMELNEVEQEEVAKGNISSQTLTSVYEEFGQEKTKNLGKVSTDKLLNNAHTSDEFVFNKKKVLIVESEDESFTNTKIYDKVNVGGILNDRKKKKAAKKIGIIDEKKNYIKNFSMLPMKSSKIEDREWMVDEPEMVAIEDHIDVPKHLINLTFGGGMANLKIDDPTHGDLKPLSAFNREHYFSLSYLRKAFNNFGIEVGLQAELFQFRMTKSLEAGTFNLEQDYHLMERVSDDNIQIEPFVNVHFFQRINRRLDLDIYAGFYAMNLPSSIERRGYSSSSTGKVEDTWLLSQRFYYGGGGRVKVGANFNILTSKINTVGLGIAYTHNIYGTPQGTYALFQSADNSLAGGNYIANGNGFKIQLTYGFGLDKDRLELRYMDKEKVFGEKNYFLSFHYGMRTSSPNTILNDCITGDCVRYFSKPNEYIDFTLGHYISDKWALGIGLGFQNMRHFVPFDMEHELYYDLQVINVPLFAQYDFYTKNKLNLYTQFGPSFDFKVGNNFGYFVNESYLPRVAEEDKLQLNMRAGFGLDFKIAKGLSIGADIKGQYAFDDVFVFEKEVAYNDERILKLAIRNTYFMGGLNLKYLFTN